MENPMNMSSEELMHNINFPISKNNKCQCEICQQYYTKTNYHNHCKTKIHKVYEELNKKLRKLIFEK